MSWQQVEGNWRQFIGEAKQRWARLTDDDLQECRGKREVLVGKLQELYGMTPDEAGEAIAQIERSISEASAGAERMYGSA